jgi:prepilin signal peptidase PulO-like enzyme (type II secretory pathway)
MSSVKLALVVHVAPLLGVMTIAVVVGLMVLPILSPAIALMMIISGCVLCILPVAHLILLRARVMTPLTTMTRMVPMLLLVLGMDIGILVIVAEHVSSSWMLGLIGVGIGVIALVIVIPSWEGIRLMVLEWDTLTHQERVGEVRRIEDVVRQVIDLAQTSRRWFESSS